MCESFTRLATSADGFVRFCRIINRKTRLKDLAMQDNTEDVSTGEGRAAQREHLFSPEVYRAVC